MVATVNPDLSPCRCHAPDFQRSLVLVSRRESGAGDGDEDYVVAGVTDRCGRQSGAIPSLGPGVWRHVGRGLWSVRLCGVAHVLCPSPGIDNAASNSGVCSGLVVAGVYRYSIAVGPGTDGQHGSFGGLVGGHFEGLAGESADPSSVIRLCSQPGMCSCYKKRL